MIRGVQYSLPFAAVGVAALAATGSMIWLRFDLEARIAGQRRRASIAEASLSSQIAAKSMYERECLETLHSQVSRFRERLGTDGTWERAVGQFGSGWNAELGARDDRSGYSIQYGTLRLISPTLADWPRIIGAVRDSEAIPGVGIAEIEMKASGSRGQRTLDLVRILLAIKTRRAEKTRAISQ